VGNTKGKRLVAVAIACTAAIAAKSESVFAQSQSNAADKFAVIGGTVVDSIRGGYLIGAVVRVNGTSLAAMTDSLGRFRIDDVSPGSHQLELIHPLLDTLGMVLKTPSMSFKAGEIGSIRLSIPSASTVVAAKCPAAARSAGPAAAIGMVLEADTDAPAVGARVSLDWVDIEAIGKAFRRSPQKRTATVQSDGSFRICGLPEDFSANAVAYRESDSTSVVGVRFAPLLAIVTLFLPSAKGSVAVLPQPASPMNPQNAPIGGATLTGRVVSSAGSPIAHARLAIENESRVALTRQDGGFILEGLRPGTRSVSVRALGFEPTEIVVAVTTRAPREVSVRLEKFVPVLKTVIVSATRDAALDRVGFSDRKAAGNGRFFSPTEIDRRNPLQLNQLLESASMLRTHRSGTQSYVTGRGNGCVRYFVDGVRWAASAAFRNLGTQVGMLEDESDSSPDGFISGAELAAVEVYDPLSAPAELASQSWAGQSCSIVVIWTKSKLRM
jgi:Carboxypeptidase regulatory-like domain